MERYIVPVQVQPLEDSEGYLAICPILLGCHAEGKTYAEAIDNLQDVARVHIELRLEKGLPLPGGLRAVGGEQPLVLEGQIPVLVGTRDRQVA
ncbi:MAG: type II toxin-antitoxin system HicB family antitoxin [Chloroflexota bacterium]|nr:type II toxin-antitoxin system HicB family antitoxin [Chloroflexota bacterium]